MKKTYITPLFKQEPLESVSVILSVSSNVNLKQSNTPTEAWKAR